MTLGRPNLSTGDISLYLIAKATSCLESWQLLGAFHRPLRFATTPTLGFLVTVAGDGPIYLEFVDEVHSGRTGKSFIVFSDLNANMFCILVARELSGQGDTPRD